jgi:hypothetical protein
MLPNASWDFQTHRLTLCYEFAAELADLYRDYGARADDTRLADSSKRKIIGASAYKANRQQTHHMRKLSR